MTKLISNFKIESISLENRKDPNIERTQNRVSVSTSLEINSSMEKLSTLNIRLFVSLAPEASRVMDFITQRYNEYLFANLISVSSNRLNEFLQASLRDKIDYLKAVRPYSPFSTNIENRNLIITNGISKFGLGQVVPKDIVIYDMPLVEVLISTNDNIANLEPISILLPDSKDQIDQMSVYGYVYDTRVPNLFRDTPEINFSINTGMSAITSATPLGNRTLFISPSPSVPLVGMQEENVLISPDKDIFQKIDLLPTNEVVQEYETLADQAKQNLQAYRPDNQYQLNKILKKNNFFSDLWITRDHKDNNKIVFAFDIRSYLVENGIYPFVYKNDKLAEILIKGGDPLSPDTLSSVKVVEVFRHKIKSEGFISTNDLGTTGRLAQVVPSKTYPVATISDVKKININLPESEINPLPSYKINFFEGYDGFGTVNSSKDQINGTYQYSTKCIIEDNSPAMLRNLAEYLYEIKRSTRSIYNFLISNVGAVDSLYNPQSGRLLQDLKKINTFLGGENINLADKILENINNYQLFADIESSNHNTSNLDKLYINYFNQDGGRIEIKIIEDFELLVDSSIKFIVDKLDVVFPKDPLGRGESLINNDFSSNSNKRAKSNLFVADHTFSETFNRGKSKGYGVDYMFADSLSGSLNTQTLEGFQNRRLLEFRKYFTAGDAAGELFPNGTYEEPSYAYFTPRSIFIPGRQPLEQINISNQNSIAAEYNYDRYAQLFIDILNISYQTEKIGSSIPTLFARGSQQSPNNKAYASVVNLLGTEFGLSISEVATPQFSAPRTTRDGSRSTIYSRQDRESCGPNGGLPLIANVIGGENTQDDTTEVYIDQVNNKIQEEATERDRGSLDSQARQNSLKERAIKLPFAILGELTLNKTISLPGEEDQVLFNSLSALKKILNISKGNIEQVIQESNISSLPNQIKSMLVIASTNEVSTLGSSAGSQGFDARRPILQEGEDFKNSIDLISYFNEQKNIPPYPQTEDPMKIYAKFLAFWMNYRQIAVVEYLNNFGSLRSTGAQTSLNSQKLKLDQWSQFNTSTSELIQQNGGLIFCRTRLLGSEDYINLIGDNITPKQKEEIIEFFNFKKTLDLPTYNQYFYIQGNPQTSTSSLGQ